MKSKHQSVHQQSGFFRRRTSKLNAQKTVPHFFRQMIIGKRLDRVRCIDHQNGDGGTDNIAAFLRKFGMAAACNLTVRIPACNSLYTDHTAVIFSGVDLLDPNLSVRLSVAILLVISGLAFILVNDDLLRLVVFYDGSCDGSAFNILPDLQAFIAYGQYLIKGNGFASFCSEFFNINRVTLGYLVLLSTSCDNCVHCVSSIKFTRQIG